MARRKQNPINDIVNTTSAWLGGNRGRATNPQTQAAMNATRAVGRVVDTATGGFGSALLSDAQRMAQSGSSTPSALYKTAAVNLAAGAAGVGAAKVVGKAVKSGRVVNPAATARNIISGERVVLHGSPKSGLPVLKPSTGSKTLPDQNVLFSWNPRKPNMSNVIHTKAVKYANKGEDAGSIYVAKVPKKATGRHPKQSVRDSKNMLVTRGEGKILAEVPLGKQYSELSRAERADVANRVQTELRKAGVQPRGVPKVVDNALIKVDDALWRAEYKVKRKIRQTFLTPAQQAQKAAARRRSIR